MTTKPQKQPINHLSWSRKPLAFLLCLFVVGFGYGQNLVENGNMEDTVFCPWAENQLPLHWTSFGATPDYLNGCSSELNVPNTPTGFHQAHSGVGMTGVYNYVDTNNSGWPDYREYIGTQLITPLVIGEKYYISFFLSFGQVLSANLQSNKIGSDKLGMKFSTIPYSETVIPTLNNFAHLFTDSIYTDTAQWVKISGSFIADSTYNYLMLGNFFDEANTDTLYFGGTNYFTFSSYYFLDDICVSTDSIFNDTWTGLIAHEQDKLHLNVYPNPAEELMNIEALTDIDEVYLINTLGQIVYQMKYENTKKIQVDVSHFPKGIYTLRLNAKNDFFTKKIFINP